MSVNPRWQRIQSLLEALESVPLEEQPGWLDAEEPDASIRQEVAALLVAMQAEASAGRPLAVPKALVLPERIGPYRIECRLGMGGRSVVYLGERSVAGGRQRVALKVLLEHLADRADLQRFEREQRILAALNHPAIARFLDAGRDEYERPYLVMEWVEGEPIDVYCHKNSISESGKISLVIQALEAVQAAHQSLIVHLDLKPSNVLVDRQGQVKVVDFGTAKLLDDAGDTTRTRLMTPRYASPEQLRGDALSTASDIYSMAATLCELLAGAGARPKASSLAALAERAAGEGSFASTGWDPDLDAVLRKAMEPEAKDRYSSAMDFAEDLRAFLEQRPVRARRPTLSYQVSRFVVRNRGGVSVVALLLLALLGFGGFAFYEQSQKVAEARRAKETAQFLTSMIESSAAAQTARPNLSVLEMVQRADARIESGFGPPADVAARLQSAFAYVMREAGREKEALEVAERGLRRADASRHAASQVVARQSRGEILIRLGRCAEALRSFGEADVMLPAARRDLEPNAVAAYLLARANAQSRCESDPKGALLRLGEAAAIAGVGQLTMAALRNVEALEHSRLGNKAEAMLAIERGLGAAGAHPDGGYFQTALLRMRSQVQRRSGDLEGAWKSISEAIAKAPGKVNRFEELRLPLLGAGILAELKRCEEARGLAGPSLGRAAEAGSSSWMLYADAGEVFARCGECAQSLKAYERVDDLTGGEIPKDWRGNRLFFSAECLAATEAPRAAELARQALEVYGKLLPESSERRKRLLLLSGQK
jgi:tRNA A-37 threonylcarbamoyl transferase component Bud32/predicted negative regulator of RcsB-dependent stress response